MADKQGMSTRIIYALAACSLAAAAIALTACESETGLSKLPDATYAQVECFDINGDHRVNDADAAVPSKLPDFDNDGKHDAADAAFVKGVDIALKADTQDEACKHKNKDWGPEYFVAHSSKPVAVNCPAVPAPVLLFGVGGGVGNLKGNDAAGVRSIVDGLQKAYTKANVQTIAVVTGESVIAGVRPQADMEQWNTHAVQTYLDRFPCLRVVFVGHSHGGTNIDVVSSRLEEQYGQRIIEVVNVDRVDVLYDGDTTSWPQRAHVFNVYETNDDKLKGAPHDAANTENWNANDQLGPRDGDEGGPLTPVNHTTIDNSKSVRQRIIDDVLKRSG